MKHSIWLEVWQKSKIVLLDIEALRARGVTEKPAEEAAQDLARLLMQYARGNAVERLLQHVISAIQFDHGEIDYTADLSRALAAIGNLADLDQDY